MGIFRRLTFNLWYFRHPPWDSGILPPEVEEYIRTHPSTAFRQAQRDGSGQALPLRALDLGCGSGTSSLALAQAGWRVTGVDFARRAIARARRKAKQASVNIDFRVDDVTRLSGTTGPFDLVLDIGCFHGLDHSDRLDYLNQLDQLLAPGGDWLMYGFFKPDEAPGPGLTVREPEEMAKRFTLLWRKDGVDKKERPSAWFLYTLAKV